MEETVNEAEIVFDPSDVQEGASSDTSEQESANEQSPAVEETTEQSAEQEQVTAEPAASTEQDAQTGDAIDEFLKTKGITANDPEALRKVATMYQNAEKGFYQKSQEKAQLERRLAEARMAQQTARPQTAPGAEALAEVRSMKTEMDVAKWKAQKNLTPEAEQKMMDWCTEPLVDHDGQIRLDRAGNPITKGFLILNGSMTLDDAYKLSGADTLEVANLREKMRNEIQQEMVARQTAKRPSAGSTDSTAFQKPDADDAFTQALLGN